MQCRYILPAILQIIVLIFDANNHSHIYDGSYKLWTDLPSRYGKTVLPYTDVAIKGTVGYRLA